MQLPYRLKRRIGAPIVDEYDFERMIERTDDITEPLIKFTNTFRFVLERNDDRNDLLLGVFRHVFC